MNRSLSRREFMKLSAFAGMAAASGQLTGCDRVGTARVENPNIVVIVADDMGYGDPKCYNSASKIPTPHMDRLAAEGIRLTDAHSPSAVCTPTRYGLLTGRYAWRTRLEHGVLQGYSRSLIEPGRMTVASLLKSRGYRTAAIGKWHLGLQAYDTNQPKPRADLDDALIEISDSPVNYDQALRPGPVTVGFDYFYGIPASLDMPPYVWVENDRVVEPATESIDASAHRRNGGGGFWRGGAIAPSFEHIDVHPVITEKSVQFIQQHAEQESKPPFFLYVPLASPHTPWLPTDEFQGITGVEPPGGHYTDFVAEVDWTVGKVMEALDRANLSKNTLIIVTSDNGAHWLAADIDRHGHRANGPWRGQKADIHEGGHRVPFIARWPGHIPENAVSDQLFCLTDLFATFAAIIGSQVPHTAAEDSFNMLPALLGKTGTSPIRPHAIHHSLTGTFAIRMGDWKLIEGLGSGGFTQPRQVEPSEGGPHGQLYNLADDPMESQNLYLEKPDVVETLLTMLNTIRQS